MKRKTQNTVTGGIVVFAIVALLLGVAINGAFVMLAFGILHSIFIAVPAISFVQGMFVSIALGILGGFFRNK